MDIYRLFWLLQKALFSPVLKMSERFSSSWLIIIIIWIHQISWRNFFATEISHDRIEFIYFIVKVKVSHVWLFVTPWIIQSLEFSRPEYWDGEPFPSPGDLPNLGIELRSPTLQMGSSSAEPQGKPIGKRLGK